MTHLIVISITSIKFNLFFFFSSFNNKLKNHNQIDPEAYINLSLALMTFK